jgi:thymidylate kinase
MNHKIIEVFGLPGVGKTTFEIELKKYLKLKNKIVLNRREIIIKYAFTNLKINFLDYAALFYFKFIEKLKNKYKKDLKNNSVPKNFKKKIIFNNLISNFFRDRYIKICKNLFLRYFENDLKDKKIINDLINKIETKNKNLVTFWIHEIFAAYYLFAKNKKDIIYLSDEGFNQRYFLILFSKLKKKTFFLKKIYKICPKPDLCIYLTRSRKIIKKVHKQRELDQSGIILKPNQIDKFIKFEKYIYQEFKNDIKYIKLNNSKKINLKKVLK